jgi:glycosyltransferase involved in cell wall biosynthesis
MLARLLDWYVSTPSPIMVWSRGLVRRHPALRSWGRATIQLALNPKAELARRLRPTIDPKMRAIMDARQVGGALSISDLEQAWDAGRRSRRALCLGETPELDQLDIMLRAANRSIAISRSLAAGADIRKFDLIVEVPRSARAPSPRRGEGWGEGVTDSREAGTPHPNPLPVGEGANRASRTLLLGESGQKRADQHGLVVPTKRSADGARSLRDKLARGDPLHVVILNDSGFQFGAGIAVRRQAASFLLKGWRVSLATWSPDDFAAPAITGIEGLDRNFRVHSLPDAADAMKKIQSLEPDIVLVGTMHGSGWPMSLMSGLRAAGTEVVAYMHDCHFVTGRCAYMGPCTKFLTGCDASCPTADEPPRLARDKIAPAWRERAAIFTGPVAVPLIANSNWTRDIALQRFGGAARTDVVHLGLDHDLFAPLSKSAARALLKLPQDKTIVALGAFDIRERRKGGPLARALCEALRSGDDVAVIIVGDASEQIPSARSFGRIEDERYMPFILSAADLFVSTATEEAFGQMLLEAAACAVPVVAFDVGGVRDVVAHGESGILVKPIRAQDLLAAVEVLVADPSLRESMGREARARVERQFTLRHQAEAWIACLQRLTSPRRGEVGRA